MGRLCDQQQQQQLHEAGAAGAVQDQKRRKVYERPWGMAIKQARQELAPISSENLAQDKHQ